MKKLKYQRKESGRFPLNKGKKNQIQNLID